MDFGTGTTFDFFQDFGKHADDRDRLNSFVKAGAILWAVALSMWADIPSGPLALVVSSANNT